MNYNDYLKTDYWKAVALAVKKRSGYRCQICNSQHDLQAHHRCYDNRGRELEHLDDLTCLCRRCHAVFHGQLSQHQPTQEVKSPKPMRSRIVNEKWVEANTPPYAEFELTPGLIDRCRTDAYGFTNATLRALGVKAPLIRGWVAKLAGTKISREAYQQALRGRVVYNSGKLNK